MFIINVALKFLASGRMQLYIFMQMNYFQHNVEIQEWEFVQWLHVLELLLEHYQMII